MAEKKGAGPRSKKPVSITEIKKPVLVNGPTSKQAFRKVEEEQRARLAKQRKAEEEWLERLIEKEEDRRKRIQTIITKKYQKAAQRANADRKNTGDAGRNLVQELGSSARADARTADEACEGGTQSTDAGYNYRRNRVLNVKGTRSLGLSCPYYNPNSKDSNS